VAKSKDSKMVEYRFKAQVLADGLCSWRQVTVVQVDHPATALADQVMVGLVSYDLVLGAAPA